MIRCLTLGAVLAAFAAQAGELDLSKVEVVRARKENAQQKLAADDLLRHLKLIAVGGVSPDNAADYLKAGCVGIAASGSLVNKDWIAAGEYDKIAEAALEDCTVLRLGEDEVLERERTSADNGDLDEVVVVVAVHRRRRARRTVRRRQLRSRETAADRDTVVDLRPDGVRRRLEVALPPDLVRDGRGGRERQAEVGERILPAAAVPGPRGALVDVEDIPLPDVRLHRHGRKRRRVNADQLAVIALVHGAAVAKADNRLKIKG